MNIELTPSQANNLIHGLDLLYTRVCGQLAAVPRDDQEIEMKMYYKTLIVQIAAQRTELKELLNN